MLKIDVSVSGKEVIDRTIGFLESDKLFERAEIDSVIAIEDTIKYITDLIQSSRKRPDRGTHKLENAIDLVEGENVRGKIIEMGIGSIAKLTAEAPYYEMIDAGATYITKKDSKLIPLTFFDGSDGFIRFKAGSSHTIVGIDYKMRGFLFLENRMKEVIRELEGKFFAGLEK